MDSQRAAATPPANDNAASSLTLTIGPNKPPGQYSVRVVGTSGSLVRSFLLTFQVDSLEPRLYRGVTTSLCLGF